MTLTPEQLAERAARDLVIEILPEAELERRGELCCVVWAGMRFSKQSRSSVAAWLDAARLVADTLAGEG
jgi:hypothetical protein